MPSIEYEKIISTISSKEIDIIIGESKLNIRYSNWIILLSFKIIGVSVFSLINIGYKNNVSILRSKII